MRWGSASHSSAVKQSARVNLPAQALTTTGGQPSQSESACTVASPMFDS
ncbi:hypothetical protein RZS08_22665 [Arthrospira platensis SPKY1]|nr:hypothetical protein [Arthrospira platensis SPKY1]